MSAQLHTETTIAASTTKGKAAISGVRRLFRTFESCDHLSRRLEERLGNLFSHGTPGRTVLEFLEPAMSGLAMGFALLCLDVWRGQTGSSHLAHFASSAAGHLEPLLFPLAGLSFGLTLLLNGSHVGRLARRVLLVPLPRLLHHAVLLAIGALAALAIREAAGGSLDVVSAGQFGLAVVLGTCLAAMAYLGLLVPQSRIVHRLEKRSASFRWTMTALGAALVFCAVSDVQETLHRMEKPGEAHAPGSSSSLAPKH